MTLTACAAPKQEGVELSQEATYTVEQNQLGEFVFCRNEECSGFERKVLEEQPVYAQTQTNFQQDEIKVFFNLEAVTPTIESRRHPRARRHEPPAIHKHW